MTVATSELVTICITTFQRPDCASRLLESIRRQHPDVSILVAEQVGEKGESDRVSFERYGAIVVERPYDDGVTASRNAMVRQVSTPYFVICDDDFVWSGETDLSLPLNVLQSAPQIAVVGGKLYDNFDNRLSKENPRHWERWLIHDRKTRTLFEIPIDATELQMRTIGNETVFCVDTVMNFAMMRTSAFSEGLAWDEQFKSNGEHEDFYLHLKENTKFEVVYHPEFVAYHCPVATGQYATLRNRTVGWKRFGEKWNLRYLVDGQQAMNLSQGEFVSVPQGAQAVESRRLRLLGYEDVPPGYVGLGPKGRLIVSSSLEEPIRGMAETLYDAKGPLYDHIRWLELENRIIQQSRSWLITAPLRRLMKWKRSWWPTRS